MRCSRALTEVISRLTASWPTWASSASAYFSSGSLIRHSGSTASAVTNACARSFGACSRSRAVHCRGLPPPLVVPPHSAISVNTARCTGALHGELERLALHHDDRVTLVVRRAAVTPSVAIGPERAGLLAPARLPAVLAGPAADRAGVPGVRADPGQHEPLVHQAEPAVQVDRVPGAQPLVLDLGHDRGRLVQRYELPFRGVQVVPAEHALDRELEQ